MGKGFVVALCAALLASCTQHELAVLEPNRSSETIEDVPVDLNRNLDVLFVIDNSDSMGEEQESLALNFGRFIEVLESLEGGLPSIHVGVISTDVGAGPYGISGCNGDGDAGRLLNLPRPDCSGPAGAFLEDLAHPDGTRTRNYDGDLAETFACMARLGTGGCGFEMPLESMRRALDGSAPGNRFFLREDAFLLVVFITDEDDCSAADRTLFDPADESLGPLTSYRCFEYGVSCEQPIDRAPASYSGCEPEPASPYLHGVDDYVTFLTGLKADPEKILVAGIIGDATPVEVDLDDQDRPQLEPSCSSAAGVAAPAVRLNYFLEQFPERNAITTICDEDLSGALELVAQHLLPLLAPCIDGDIDLDPDQEGIQYECQVSDIRYPGTPTQEERPLSECETVPPPEGTMPCWHLEHRPDVCVDTETQLAVVIERGGANVPPGTYAKARCQTR